MVFGDALITPSACPSARGSYSKMVIHSVDWAARMVTIIANITTNVTLSGRYEFTTNIAVSIIIVPRIFIICMESIVFHAAAEATLIYSRVIVAGICWDDLITFDAVCIHHIGKMIWTFRLATIAALPPDATVMTSVCGDKLTTVRAILINTPTLMKSRTCFNSATIWTFVVSKIVRA